MEFISRLKFVAYLVCFFSVSICTSMMSEGVVYSKWTSVRRDMQLFPFHEENALLVVAAKYKLNKSDTSNVAAIGFTVYGEPGKSCHEILFLLHSGLSSDESKPLDVDGRHMFPVPAIFREDPILSCAKTRTHNLLTYLTQLETCPRHRMASTIERLSASVRKKLATRNDLDKVGELVNKEERRKLGALLHCEQVAFLRMLTDARVFIPLIEKIKVSGIGNVTNISLDVITFNDMCMNCFSTAYYFIDQLEKACIDAFTSNGLALSREYVPHMQLIISSIVAFTNGDGRPTRNIIPGKQFCDSILANPFDISGVVEDRIVHFVNPWIFEHILLQEKQYAKASLESIKLESMLAKKSDFSKQVDLIKSLPIEELKLAAKEFGYNPAIVNDIFDELSMLITEKIANFKLLTKEVFAIADSLLGTNDAGKI